MWEADLALTSGMLLGLRSDEKSPEVRVLVSKD